MILRAASRALLAIGDRVLTGPDRLHAHSMAGEREGYGVVLEMKAATLSGSEYLR
jgi:hypothetical protein